jgi:spermidine synthase
LRPWEEIATAKAPDGTRIDLRRRGHEYLIRAGGCDLMSSEDERSSCALAERACAHLDPSQPARILVGGLGMGYTLRAALDVVGEQAVVEVAELVPAVAEWNRGVLGDLAGKPLLDQRVALHVADVRSLIQAARSVYDVILLDVDNGPEALVHPANDRLYTAAGLAEIRRALGSGGALGVWSFSHDDAFTSRLQTQGFAVEVHSVPASRKGRGRHHVVWVARA